MPKARVIVDGYHLALEKGTGIATTNVRSLSAQLSTLGHQVDFDVWRTVISREKRNRCGSELLLTRLLNR